MNRKTFINEIKNNLIGLDEDQVNEIITDYEEHFEVGKEKDRTEDEISESLGDPKELAKQLSKKQKQVEVEAKVEKAEKDPTAGNIIRAIFATAALGFFNIVFVLGPASGIFGAIVGVSAASISVVASGIAVSVSSLLIPFLPYRGTLGMHPAVIFFGGLGVAALGVIMCIGVFYVWKVAFKLTIAYLKFNLKLIYPQE